MKDFSRAFCPLHPDSLMLSRCLLYDGCVPSVSDEETSPDIPGFLSFYSLRGFKPVLSQTVYSHYHQGWANHNGRERLAQISAGSFVAQANSAKTVMNSKGFSLRGYSKSIAFNFWVCKKMFRDQLFLHDQSTFILDKKDRGNVTEMAKNYSVDLLQFHHYVKSTAWLHKSSISI